MAAKAARYSQGTRVLPFTLPYYGRVDTLLEQMHDTLRDFNQSH